MSEEHYEAFCDAAYFDMWCVRRIGERTFGQGFHVINQDSAFALKAELEALTARITQLEAELAGAREALDALFWSDYYGIGDDMHSNGCSHGFKPARACQNENCEKRKLHEQIDRALAQERTDD